MNVIAERPRARISVELYQKLIATGDLTKNDRVELIKGDLLPQASRNRLQRTARGDWHGGHFASFIAATPRCRKGSFWIQSIANKGREAVTPPEPPLSCRAGNRIAGTCQLSLHFRPLKTAATSCP